MKRKKKVPEMYNFIENYKLIRSCVGTNFFLSVISYRAGYSIGSNAPVKPPFFTSDAINTLHFENSSPTFFIENGSKYFIFFLVSSFVLFVLLLFQFDVNVFTQTFDTNGVKVNVVHLYVILGN